MTQRYDAIDLMKWICSLLVVVIHTTPLKPYSYIADVVSAQGICRIAVPFFFSASGFFLFSKMRLCMAENINIVKKYCSRLMRIYCIWSIIYLPLQIKVGNIALDQQFIWLYRYMQKFLMEASIYHLWYLLATVYAVPIVCCAYTYVRKGGIAPAIFLVALLWSVRCLQYTYNWLGWFSRPLRWLQTNCDVVTNVLFCAVPLMIIGVFAIQGHGMCSHIKWRKRTILMSICYIVELMVAYNLSKDKVHFEYLLSTPLLTYNLLCYLLTAEFSLKDNRFSEFFKNSSLWIYCTHVFFILLYDYYIGGRGILRFISVAIVCVATSFVYTNLKRLGVMK